MTVVEPPAKRQRTNSFGTLPSPPGDNVDDSITSTTTTTSHDGGVTASPIPRHPTELMTPREDVAQKVAPTEISTKGGRMKSVTIQNFMCHHNLTVALNPHLTFISGANGSGKSAILTAITACLGVSASKTNRATSVKEFVRNGANKATVRILFDNSGPDAYLPDKYGNLLTIERVFTSSGAASYRTLDYQGAKISDKKSEIHNILTQFNIQIDNEFVVLNQDKAREFINATSESELYKLVMQSLLFDETMAYNSNALQACLSAEQDFASKTETLQNLRATIHTLRSQYKRKDERVSLQVEKRSLKAAVAYHRAQQNTDAAATIQAKITELESRAVGFEAEIAKLQSASALEAEQEELTRQRVEIQDLRTEKNQDIRNLDQKCKTIRQAIKDHEKRVQALEKKVSKEKSNIAAHEAELKTIQQDSGSKESKVRTLREVKDKILSLSEFISNVTVDASVDEIARVEAELASLKSQIDAVETRYNDLINRKNNLQRSSNSGLEGYDQNMRSLINTIEANKSKFKNVPIGPLGRYIELTQPEWSPLLEGYFSNLLDAFIVDNQADNDLLMRFIKDARAKCTVYNRRVEAIDLSSRQARSQYPSILDVLNIKEPRITSLLADERSIHSVVLIADRKTASRVAAQNANDNISLVLSRMDPSPTIPHPKNGHRHPRSSNGSGQAVLYASDRPPRMRVGQQFELDSIQSDISNCNAEKQTLNAKARDANHRLQKARDTKRSVESELKSKTAEKRTLEKSKAKIEQELDIELENARITTLEGQIEAAKEEISSLNDSIAVEYVSLETTRESLTQVEANKSKALEESNAYNDRFTSLGLEIKKLEQSQRKSTELVRELEVKVARTRRKVTEITALRDEKDAAANNYKEKAQKLSAHHVELAVSEEDAVQRIVEIDAKLKHIDDVEGIDFDKIQQELTERAKEYNELTLNVEKLDKLGKKLRKEIKARREAYKHLQTQSFNDIRDKFADSMRARGFKAQLLFDDVNRKISMLVDTKQGAERSVTTFSGGEKSFTMVALLLSIWSKSSSSLSILDEYDVFMDNVNRKRALDLILRMMREAGHFAHQYVIISPLDIPLNEEDQKKDDITIFRLDPPTR